MSSIVLARNCDPPNWSRKGFSEGTNLIWKRVFSSRHILIAGYDHLLWEATFTCIIFVTGYTIHLFLRNILFLTKYVEEHSVNHYYYNTTIADVILYTLSINVSWKKNNKLYIKLHDKLTGLIPSISHEFSNLYD